MIHRFEAPEQPTLSESMLAAIRRVIRAVDLHSKQLEHSHQLTGPQALVLRALAGAGQLAPSALARRISLSQATVTDIVNRLERRGLLARSRDRIDRRRVLLRLTPRGRRLEERSPPLLQDRFLKRFDALEKWEQHMLLSTMQRIAAMMDAHTLDAAPLLSSDRLDSARGEEVDDADGEQTMTSRR